MPTEYGYYIVPSKMNPIEKEKFEVIDSMEVCPQRTFLEEINFNMNYYGINAESLSKATNISNFRISCLIKGNAKFEPHELEKIKRILHL